MEFTALNFWKLHVEREIENDSTNDCNFDLVGSCDLTVSIIHYFLKMENNIHITQNKKGSWVTFEDDLNSNDDKYKVFHDLDHSSEEKGWSVEIQDNCAGEIKSESKVEIKNTQIINNTDVKKWFQKWVEK